MLLFWTFSICVALPIIIIIKIIICCTYVRNLHGITDWLNMAGGMRYYVRELKCTKLQIYKYKYNVSDLKFAYKSLTKYIWLGGCGILFFCKNNWSVILWDKKEQPRVCVALSSLQRCLFKKEEEKIINTDASAVNTWT